MDEFGVEDVLPGDENSGEEELPVHLHPFDPEGEDYEDDDKQEPDEQEDEPEDEEEVDGYPEEGSDDRTGDLVDQVDAIIEGETPNARRQPDPVATDHRAAPPQVDRVPLDPFARVETDTGLNQNSNRSVLTDQFLTDAAESLIRDAFPTIM